MGNKTLIALSTFPIQHMETLKNEQLWGNPLLSWIIVVVGILLAAAVLRLFKNVALKQLKKWALKTDFTFDDFLVELVDDFAFPVLYAGVIYVAANYLILPDKVTKIIRVAFLLVITYYALRSISAALKYFIFSFLQDHEHSEGKQKQAKGLIMILNVVIWGLGIVFLMDNLGYNVATLLAGLGIGGIAIALAAQVILGDLFSYFVIFFDRPFEIGDYITVQDKMGTVEYIGIKTTRLRTPGGEQLICSNTDLTNSRVHNFKRMEKRRVLFALGVIYETPPELLKTIPDIIKQCIERQEGVQFDRAHFSGFGDFSLNFECVYYVLSSDYAVHMTKQQAVFLDIFDEFTKAGIGFAYPTQQLYVQQVGLDKGESKNG
jgi:small-conductance mechanosensitive channel